MAEVPSQPSFALLRITVLGSAGSGKTSLINAFVSNFCPAVHEETRDPVLYYKTLQLPGEDQVAHEHVGGNVFDMADTDGNRYMSSSELQRYLDANKNLMERFVGQNFNFDKFFDNMKNSFDANNDGRISRVEFVTFYAETMKDKESPPVPLMVEIEDTYAPQLNTGNDCYGQKRDASMFLDMAEVSNAQKRPEGAASGILLRSGSAPVAGKYLPLAKRRMGFMIVFEAGDEKSLNEAIKAHKDLLLKNKELTVKPIVIFVATKIDKDPKGAEQSLKEASHYTDTQKIELYEVCSKELKRVKRLFRNMLAEIRASKDLWKGDDRPDGEAPSAATPEGSAGGGPAAKTAGAGEGCVAQ